MTVTGAWILAAALPLSTTRERSESVSVLFADMASYTTFAEQSTPAEVASMLNTYYERATPLLSQRFGGQVEKFIGDAILATFNSRGDQPDHAVRAARAALELQRQMGLLADPPNTVVEPRSGLMRKGKETPVDAYLLHSVPA